MTVDDPLLLDLARRGSSDAVSELYERYWPLASRWAYLATGNLVDAEDVAQDAICRAFRELARHDSNRPFGPFGAPAFAAVGVDGAVDASQRPARRRSRFSEQLRTAACEPHAGPLSGTPA